MAPPVVEPPSVAKKRPLPSPSALPALSAAEGVPSLPPLPGIDELRRSIPPECFVPNEGLALLYFFAYGATLASAAWTHTLCSSWLATAAYALFYGTVMWGLFVIGHDCGHGTFSRSFVLNSIVGHLAHAPLLVPFWPWALSHRAHHTHHNHVENDFSHVWLTPAAEREMDSFSAFVANSHPVLLLLTPFYFGLYLFFGLPDGSHVLPWGRLWERTHAGGADRARGVVSSLAVAAFLFALYARGFLGWAYFAPWLVYNSWLFIVTYMQHHREGIVVYGDETWTFVRGAFETVDRELGWGVDGLVLHITSDHLVHHLFSTGIPHYSLPKATAALRAALRRSGADASHQRVAYATPLHYFAHFAETMLSCGFKGFKLLH